MKGVLVVTDLDGALLDEATYDPAPATLALRRLEEEGVPLVLASSKTRTEMEALSASLPGGRPLALVVENGGAIVRLDGGRGRPVTVLGAPHPHLVRALGEIAGEVEASLTGFSALPPREIERLTGLSAEEVARGRRREYDEPFLIAEGGDVAKVAAAAHRRGLRVSRGGRFLHLTGGTDKGRAFRVLLGQLAAEGRLFTTLGLGDAPNDLPLLEAVDEAVLVPRPDGRVDETLRRALPRAQVAPAPGPVGWNAAVLAYLDGRSRLTPSPGPAFS
jgi:mannosyl-3-phosphoglycerate phosphatase